MLDEDRTEVARLRLAPAQRHRTVASPEDEALGGEEAGVGVIPQIEPECIAPASVVTVLEMQVGDGDVLTAVARRPAGLSEPATGAGDEHVPLSLDHTLDIGLSTFVVDDGDGLSVGGVGGATAEPMTATEVRAGSTCEDVTELLLLEVLQTARVLLDTTQAELGDLVDERGL